MNYKIILLALALIILSNFVMADLSDNLVSVWKLDNNSLDSYGANNGVNISVVYNTSVFKENISGSFDGTSSYISFGDPASLKTGNASISAWVYPDAAPSSRTVYARRIDATTYLQLAFINANQLSFGVAGGGSNCVGETSAYSWTGTWSHVVGTYSGTNLSIYINGTIVNSTTCAVIPWTGGAGEATIGRLGLQALFYWDGVLDEVYYWNRSLTYTEVNNLWNAGIGRFFPFSATTNTTVNFTAVDDYNGSVISNFSIDINWNNGTVQTESTTTGGVYLDLGLKNDSLTANISYYGVTDYFNLTLYDQTISANTSTTITAEMYQAVVCFEGQQKVSNNSLTLDNATISSTTRYTPVCFNLTAENHNVKAEVLDWYTRNQTFSVSALQNDTQTIIEFYSSISNLSVFQSNGTILSTYGINITSITYPNWTGEIGSTTNGSYYFNGINGTYRADINSSLGNESFYFTITAALHNFSYYYFTLTNCTPFGTVVLNFTMMDELANTRLENTNLSIWFNITSSFYIGTRTFNLSYFSGNDYLVCIPNGTATNFTAYAQMKYSGNGTTNYDEKNYYLVDYPLSNSSIENIFLYLTNGTTQVKLQVRDYTDEPLSDVYIKVRTYDLGTNSYKTTEIVKTDSDGDAYAQMILNTEWYSFILEYDGEIILQTLPTKITSTTRTFRVNLETDYFASYDVVQGVIYDLSFTNATTSFSFTWSDPTGGVETGCLKLTRRTINGDTVLNTTCVSSTSSTILMNISDGMVGSNTYIGDAYITIGGQSFLLDSLSQTFNNTFKTFGASGIFLSFLVILTLVMVGIWSPVIAVVMMILGVIATNVMGIFYLNWVYMVTLVILGVITIYRSGKSE